MTGGAQPQPPTTWLAFPLLHVVGNYRCYLDLALTRLAPVQVLPAPHILLSLLMRFDCHLSFGLCICNVAFFQVHR